MFEASVGSCCRHSWNVADSSTRVILFDTNPGALTNTTERDAYIGQYVGQDFSRCPCMCKHDPSKSARRRQWWGGSGRRRRSGVRSDEEAAAVAAQASCPFAADHEDTEAKSPSPSSSSGSSPVAASPTPAPTPAPVVTVSGVWIIAMENASKLWNNAEGLAAFEKALKKAVVQLLDVGLIKEDHIQVEISETSGHSRRLSSSSAKGLKVTYMIRVPNGVEASGVVTKINSKSTDELRTSVDSALIESAKTAPDIKGLTSSAVTIAAQGSLNTKSAASELSLSLSGRATAHAVLVLAISLLGATTFSMTNK